MVDSGNDPTETDERDSFDDLLQKAAHVSEVAPRSMLAVGDTLLDGRFTIRRALGEGGMGTVYETWDRERHGLVALKTLGHADPAAVYFLKNEFRALAEVTHPNLVALHEFFGDGERWFFTMERVRGRDFRAHVALRDDAYLTQRGGEPRFHEGRLRETLVQLVTGASAVHAAGKLHCDLKPSNVMVEESGRVVLLDFGLVSDVREDERVGHTLGNVVAGTPLYMAPEQAGSGAVAASDLYAIGVMLYEALCGVLPFEGNPTAVLVRKQAERPKPPSELAAGVPEDLEALCLSLLATAPEERPTAAQVLELLSPSAAGGARRSLPAPGSDELLRFVGRRGELEQLMGALTAGTQRGPRLMLLSGPSGIGKTRLLSRFAELSRRQSDAVVLGGRCHERESVPYNAFDSLIDALSRTLRRLPELEAARLMPRDVHTLVRLFPVLSRVQAVTHSPGRSPAGLDPMELRRRAFGALKELLARMGDASPLLLCFDDLQWADDDSLRLLRELLSEPDPPAALVLGTLRSGIDDSAVHRELGELSPQTIELGPLGDDDVRAIVEGLAHMDDSQRKRLQDEAGGNPFLLGELVAHARQGQDAGAAAGFDAVLGARLSPLPEDARNMLNVLCISARPLPLPALLDAAGVGGGVSRLLTLLRNGHFLRTHRGSDGERLELYHDRIRAALSARIEGAPRRRLHGQLAESLEKNAPGEHEHVAEHWLLAGESGRASEHLLAAAELADASYAFAVAARLYATAIEHSQGDGRLQLLHGRLGDALSRTGRAGEAARAYLAAAELADDSGQRMELSRTAAQHLLACGELDEGTKVLRRALDETGVQYPESPELAERWLSLRHAQLADGGLQHTVRDARNVDPQLLSQIDLCCAVSPALGLYDFVRAGYFAAHGLLLALEAGEPSRVARALSTYATSLASSGELARARELSEHSLEMARGLGDEELLANAEMVSGQVALFGGEFEAAVERCDAARERFRKLRVGASQEVPICHVFSNMALHMLGRMREHVARSQAQLAEARDLGHILSEASLRVFGIALGELADDAPGRAREQAAAALQLWPQQQFHGERFKVLRLEAWCDLYEGTPARAVERIAQARQTALDSRILQSSYWRFWWFDLVAHVGLMAAAAGDAAQLTEARAAVEQLEGDNLSYAQPLITTYRAGLAHLAGDRTAALDLLEEVTRAHDPILAACAARTRGEQLGDTTAVTEADRVLAQSVKRPEAWARWRVPGWNHARFAQERLSSSPESSA